MVLKQLTSVFVIPVRRPPFAAPRLERRLSTSLPATVAPKDLVVTGECSARSENLLDELGTGTGPPSWSSLTAS